MKTLKKETEKLFHIIKMILNFLINTQHIFYMSFPFLAMDLITRIFGYNINFGILAYPITIFFIVACINIINLIDILGITGGCVT